MSQSDTFEAQMHALLGDEWEALRAALREAPPTSIRLNAAKAAGPPAGARAVPWSDGLGWYLEGRPSFTRDPLFHAGAWYVQEASSMFVGWLARQARALDRRRWHAVLDLCAAPGGKTTHLLSLMPEEEVLVVANEVVPSRRAALQHNLARWGMAHALHTQHDPAEFGGLRGFFDLVVVDAPCSGEGLFRKMPEARAQWSASQVRHCALRQHRILEQAASLVRAGGWLIYSTCTWNRRENEAQVAQLETRGFALVPLDLPSRWGICWSGQGWRFYPHRLEGEGFFAALLRKEGESPAPAGPTRPARLQRLSAKRAPSHWLDPKKQWSYWQDGKGHLYASPQPLEAQVQQVAAALPTALPALALGQTKGRHFIPAPALALSTHLAEVPSLAVDADTARALLRGHTPPLATSEKGVLLVRHQGLGLLWIKALGNRINNYYPKAWRIRHL